MKDVFDSFANFCEGSEEKKGVGVVFSELFECFKLFGVEHTGK